MKPALILGILLIILGVAALAYQGITYRTQEKKKILDLGPLQATATIEREKTFPLPPILGVAALSGGIVLLLFGARKS
jgi:hypothetical protein